jgi:hypothetical protein
MHGTQTVAATPVPSRISWGVTLLQTGQNSSVFGVKQSSEAAITSPAHEIVMRIGRRVESEEFWY